MSQEIVCKECAFANPPGSKFCNNCGTKLPLGTHIICVNCGTSNPIDRVFCDHCGTRLIPEEPRSEAKDEQPAPGKGAFSLPARRPGDTGDLDPRKVPDWLKTGKTSDEEESDNDQDLPRIEELTRKRHTDDLPEWLVDDEDSDPIIHAPTIISTELYHDLLGRAEADLPQPDDLFPEEEADLPDWLKDAGSTTSKPAAAQPKPADKEAPPEKTEAPPSARPSTPKSEESGQSLTSWLSAPLEEEEDEWPLAKEPDSSLTSWLTQDDLEAPSSGKADRESLTSWLSETPAAEDDTWSFPAESDSADLTDWLNTQDDSHPESPDESQDSLTDWLSDFPEGDEDEGTATDTGRLTAWFSEAAEKSEQVDIPQAENDLGPDSLTDWLSDFPEDEEESEPSSSEVGRLTAWFSTTEDEAADEGMEEPSVEQVKEDLTDWLSDFPDDDEDETWVESDTGSSEVGRLTAWFSDAAEEAAEQGAAPAEEDTGSWLDAFSDDDDTVFAGPVVQEPDSGGLTAWLSESAAEELAAEDADEISDMPDEWMEGAEDEGAATAVADAEDEHRLTGWLSAEEEKPQAAPTAGSAVRLAALFSEQPDQADEDTEQFDWLDEPVQPVAAIGKQELPSDLAWLDETEEELASIFQSQPGIEEELPDWLAGVAAVGDSFMPDDDEAVNDSLEDIFRAESKAAATEIDFLRETGSLQLDDEIMQKLRPGDTADEDMFGESILSDEPDWLAALAIMGPDDTGFFDAAAKTAAVPDASMADLDEGDLDETLIVAASAPSTPPAPAGEEEWLSQDEELPDWISQLDATAPLPDMVDEEDDLIASDELPDWVASLRPSQVSSESSLTGGLRDKTPETLAGVPEELAGADLPAWLQDISRDADNIPSIAMPADTQLSDIPDWLQPGLTLAALDADILGEDQGGTLEMGGVSDEWSAILDDLPPAVPLQDLLPKADIPDWVMQLKPVELTGESPTARPTGPEESFGPLSGLRGVVTVEPVVALPRVAASIEQFTVSSEQRQQVELLRQLASDGQGQEAVSARQAARDISGWIRPLFAVVLFLVVVLGLQGVIPVNSARLEPTDALAGVHTAVQDVAGETVLVAFDYSPAMAGELTPEAETILSQLAQEQTTILTLSQYTTGVAVAADITQLSGTNAAVHLGYLPGGAIGLRRLGECLNRDDNCDVTFGAPLSNRQKQLLDDVSLIMVLTADRQTLVNWIEQVGGVTERPMVAGVTQALSPLAQPYFETGQLAGVVNGVPGTAVYQQTYYQPREGTDASKLFDAQVAAQILLVVVLLLGALIYLITGIAAQRRAK